MGCIKSKQGLSQEDLEFLRAHTRYDENTIKEWYKGFKQDCPNGRLTPVKFVDMYKMFFPSGNAEQFCDHVFRTFDTDKNGYIDFKEFLTMMRKKSSETDQTEVTASNRFFDYFFHFLPVGQLSICASADSSHEAETRGS